MMHGTIPQFDEIKSNDDTDNWEVKWRNIFDTDNCEVK